MMLSIGNQNQNMDGKRHCILVAASNPYPLPTPVYRPQTQHIDAETPSDYHLSDAEALAKSFAQCNITLSVICPKKLPKLKAIYNAGKSNPQVEDPPEGDHDNNPHLLVLISDNFMKILNQNTAKMASVPPGMSEAVQPTMQLVGMSGDSSEPVQPRMQLVGMSGDSSATKMAINQQTSSAMLAAMPQHLKVWEGYRNASQSDTLASNWPQTMEMVEMISHDDMENKLRIRKADLIVFNTMDLHLLPCDFQEKKRCGVIRLPSQTLLLTFSEKRHRLIGWLLPGDMVTAAAEEVANSQIDSAANITEDAKAITSAMQAGQPETVKFWEGNLSGRPNGQLVVLARIKGFRKASEPDNAHASDWPQTLAIIKFISLIDMRNMGLDKGEMIVFQTTQEHSLLSKLENFAGVILLPRQTLLVTCTDKPHTLIGNLLPGDTVPLTSTTPAEAFRQGTAAESSAPAETSKPEEKRKTRAKARQR